MLWVEGKKIDEVLTDAQATKPYVDDDVVREFVDWDEARAFAARTTDHIGNLPGPAEPGTWVRFDQAGLNIVGEEHDYLSLEQTVAAVRSNRFIYEQFATDVLAAESEFKKAYLVENTALLSQFGVDLLGELTLVGGESLLPKIADTVAELVPFFDKTADMKEMTSGEGRYWGQPDQRYIKIGWGWAKDLAGHAKTGAETLLVQAVNTHRAILEPFITGLPVDGFLGDPLVLDIHADKYAPLLELCQAYVPVMIERAHTDPGITGEEQQVLKEMPTGTVEEQQRMFALWRNLYFAKAVENAAARGVRYAGMGDHHRKWLQRNHRVPDNAHVHVVTRKYFKAVVERTGLLRSS
ncbi:hypothetical protein O7627_19455 [Solwaraspora sp. WMMD1047]|uniref:hypothetical protein n=1 Tax=Solwaraspora sp. WMMD1047 TaxID=3016102 RepID=UPI0024162EED|nr:hypothetical protein [Solwaraspora sp. WMMD1047]MDG4831478.1 hypothetical protein [Solwaraspora sp. WMMD1047]